MAPRYTEAEKGKNHLNEDQERKVMRIKAPNLDNSALIRDNALTLIGRLTNPQEQRMWALFQPYRANGIYKEEWLVQI